MRIDVRRRIEASDGNIEEGRRDELEQDEQPQGVNHRRPPEAAPHEENHQGEGARGEGVADEDWEKTAHDSSPGSGRIGRSRSSASTRSRKLSISSGLSCSRLTR